MDNFCRDLNEMMIIRHSYVDNFKKKLDSIKNGLSKQISLVQSLEPLLGEELIRYLFELSCQCQNMTNIELGRAAILALPRDWLLQNFRAGAELLLKDEETDWVFHRLLEVCENVDNGLMLEFAQKAYASQNTEIKEVGKEYLSDA